MTKFNTTVNENSIVTRNWSKLSTGKKVMRVTLFTFWVIGCIIAFAYMAEAAGLGQYYFLENGGNVQISVTKEPHQESRQWGYIYNNESVAVGFTDEGETFDLGWFNEEAEIVFWVEGKNKTFFTGKSNKATTDDQFVINGTHFEISVEEGNPQMVGTAKMITETFVAGNTSVNDCSDPSVSYTQGQKVKFEMVASKDGYDSLRIVMNVHNDWTILHDGEITAEVTLNDSCAYTFSATDEVNYFYREDKDYEGHRLVEYKFPEGITYFGKLRVTTERGVDKHYIYLNNVDAWDLVGSQVNVKVRLYQDGELVQAFEMDANLAQKIKR